MMNQRLTSMDLHHTHVLAIAQYIVKHEGGDRKINCIKAFRQLTGCGLLESKLAIEYIINDSDATILTAMHVRRDPPTSSWKDDYDDDGKLKSWS